MCVQLLATRRIPCCSASSNVLTKMEYRGYDSVGIGTINEGKVSVKKELVELKMWIQNYF